MNQLEQLKQYSNVIHEIPETALAHIHFHNRDEFIKALKENSPAFALLKDGIFRFTKAFLKLRQIVFHQPKPVLMLSVMYEMIRQNLKMR